MTLWTHKDFESALTKLSRHPSYLFRVDKQGNVFYEQEKKISQVQLLHGDVYYTDIELFGRMKNDKKHFTQTHARRVLTSLLGEPHHGKQSLKKQKYYVKGNDDHLGHVVTMRTRSAVTNQKKTGFLSDHDIQRIVYATSNQPLTTYTLSQPAKGLIHTRK